MNNEPLIEKILAKYKDKLENWQDLDTDVEKILEEIISDLSWILANEGE